MAGKGVNKVILVGNLGKDPEIRYATSGVAVTNITLATTDTWRNKQTGENEDRTEWHRIIFFNKLAEIANQYLRKGAKIFLEGSLQTRKWTDKDGHERYTTEIIANEMVMLDKRSDGPGGFDQFGSASQPGFQNFQTPGPATQAGANQSAGQSAGFATGIAAGEFAQPPVSAPETATMGISIGDDDDIPF